MMILRGEGVTLFPYYDLVGAVENSNENYIEHSGGEGNHFLDLLVSKYKKDSRLFDALQELKDGLLDNTAWPVVMQWFNEDH